MTAEAHTFAVIMAGGVGTRFWPLSRRRRPKQFLPLAAGRTMIEETFERLRPLLPLERILTVSDRTQAAAIRRLVPGLPAENALIEPAGRNTTAALMLATAAVSLRDPEAIVFALPADHLISDSALFVKKLRASARAAADDDVIVTFGVPPTYPATGFGYIQFSNRHRRLIAHELFYPVLRFTEKPSTERARDFLAEGRHFWNSGMFIWRARVFVAKLERHAPTFFSYWGRILRSVKSGNRRELSAVYRDIPAMSIDYSLMERADGVLMNQGTFGWSDVGSWVALADVWPKDEAGHVVRGEGIFIDSRDCFVYSPKKLTAVVGLKDVIVVDTPDALLVCHKDSDQKVREIIETLKKRGRKEYL